MRDIREAYNKGYHDGQRVLLRLLDHILDDSPLPGYKGLSRYYKESSEYYKHSLESLLEVYNYGKEEKEEN